MAENRPESRARSCLRHEQYSREDHRIGCGQIDQAYVVSIAVYRKTDKN